MSLKIDLVRDLSYELMMSIYELMMSIVALGAYPPTRLDVSHPGSAPAALPVPLVAVRVEALE